MPEVVISILGLNRLEYSKRCVEALLRYSNDHDYVLYLTDNGSSDGTREYFQGVAGWHPNIRVIENEKNEGFIGPNNYVFEQAVRMSAKYFIALNNDTEPPENWLDYLLEPLNRNPQIAATGPLGTCHYLNDDFHGGDGPKYEYVEGSCLCVRVETLQKEWGYLFSPYLDFIYGDDSDLSLRLRERGYRIEEVSFYMVHSRGETVQTQPEVKERCNRAQEHNHAVLRNRWAYYIKHRNFSQPIVIKRKYAIGDCILATGLIRDIKKIRPQSKIFVETDYPEVFANNPHVAGAHTGLFRLKKLTQDALTIDLDGVYEKRTNVHIVEAYYDEARKLIPDLPEPDFKTELYPLPRDMAWARNLKQSLGTDKLCLLHADSSWTGKTWPREKWGELANRLVNSGWHVAVVGTHPKHPEIKDAIDLTQQGSLLQLAALCSQSQLFIGHDSGPLHVAMSMGCPSVGLFGVTSKRYILTNNGPRIGVESDCSLQGSGLRHRVIDSNHVEVGPEVMDNITVESVMRAVEVLTK